MLRARTACTLMTMFLLGACALEPLQPRGSVRPESDTRVRPPAPSRKEVVEKRDLNLLIARDGTRCTVSEQAYRSTSVGDHVTCFWRRGT
jgi:hypothetical protein